MTIGRFITMPEGFRWPASARARMPRIDISTGAQDLARLLTTLGAVKVFDPADFQPASRSVIDRLDGSTYAPSDANGAAPTLSTIGGQAALTFVTTGSAQTNTRRLANLVARSAGSFSIAVVWSVAAGVTTSGTAPVLVSIGNAAAFYLNGELNLTLDGNAPAIKTGVQAGAHVGIMSYDAATRTLTWVDETGTVSAIGTYDSPAPAGLNIMGNFADGRDLGGMIGRVILFNRALHDADDVKGSVAEPAKAIIDVLRGLYQL
ncbi:hypothetical protein DRN02_005275 [Sphingomonas paucimobilis]|uniref:hypothetical protein n=1 Tax=Sphingomonas paucimobilis TaxID=13689 RepID=UPI000DE27363|nr:hypothetical protein [Sphingomonas paucimobilis]QBE91500.1 hypothetical protein DRN02_005275 [Sphingomonas paucimobilis]